MKKIILIMESWKRYFTSAWPIGFMEKIHESNEQVCLYIFNSSDGLSYSKNYQTGEYNIFRLPNFDDFDGAMIDMNNIKSESIHEEIVEKLRKADIPVISIANDIEGFNYVGINNYNSMKSIVEHVHKEHGCKRFYCVMGPDENFETIERTRAIKDYFNENNIDYDDDDFYFESYEYDTGCHGFIMRINSKKEFPDAIICGNDNIAVGVCETAKEFGYKIPEDLIVTGFDNFDKASYYIPRITTVGHVREDVGYKCAEHFLNYWKGEPMPKKYYTDVIDVWQESCGCKAPALDARERLKDNILSGIRAERFDELSISLEYDLSKCATLSDMMTALVRYIPPMNVGAFYVVIDDLLNHKSKGFTDYNGQPVVETPRLISEGYSESMKVMLAFSGGRRKYEDERYISSLFPTFNSNYSDAFLFMPIHFQEHTVGYIAVKHPLYIMETQFLFQVVAALTSAIEKFHRNKVLENMNQVLTELYIKDSMTGLYNRIGLMKLAPEFINKAFEQRISVQVIFIDLDKLKYINDTFGHGQGDFAISTMGNIISSMLDKNDIAVRNGGDEFIIIKLFDSIEKTEGFLEELENAAMKHSVRLSLPYELSLSAGYSVMDYDGGKTLEMAIKEADDMMYSHKTKKGCQR